AGRRRRKIVREQACPVGLQAVAPPQGAHFERRDQVVGKAWMARDRVGEVDAGQSPAKQRALGGYQRRKDFLAEALAQCRAQIAYTVGQAEFDRFSRRPEFSGKQRLVRSIELSRAARFDQIYEVRMDVLLDRLDTFDILRLLRKERIEHHLAVTGRVEPALDPKLVHQFVKTESSSDHSDRSDDGELVANDLVCSAGQHVASRSADILDEGQYRDAFFVGQLPYAPIDQMRLCGRAAWGIYDQSDRTGARHRKRPFQRAGDRRQK